MELFYLSGAPFAFVALVVALIARRLRIQLLLISVILMGAWALDLNWLQSRSHRILNFNASTTDQALHALGTPDKIIQYPEGDSDWMYGVRVWPWNNAVDFAVYRDRVLMIHNTEDAGFFFEPPVIKRSDKASAEVKAFLALQDADLHRDRKK